MRLLILRCVLPACLAVWVCFSVVTMVTMVTVVATVQASESMLGFLLERLGKLPVGHAKFAGKGVEAKVWNLDLEGVHVKRENVDLVMKGFRLPKRCVCVCVCVCFIH